MVLTYRLTISLHNKSFSHGCCFFSEPPSPKPAVLLCQMGKTTDGRWPHQRYTYGRAQLLHLYRS